LYALGSGRIYLEDCSLNENWRIKETMKENRKLDLTGAGYEKKI